MGSFSVEWKHSAAKELRRIDPFQIRSLVKAVEALAADPFPPGHRKLRNTENEYRIRVGDYRVIYGIQPNAGIVTILYVRHRSDVYRRR